MALPFFSKQRMLARLTILESLRSVHIKDWQKITEVIRPSRGIYIDGTDTENSKRPTSMVNSTPAVASRTLRAGMISGASSPSYQWFKFDLDDADMQKWGPARVALEQRENIINKYLARSNFYQILETAYGDGADFGTAAGLIDLNGKDMFAAKLFSPGQYFIDVDETGDINTYYLKVPLTVWQIMSRWKDSASQKVKDAYANGNYSTRFTVIQVIEENLDFEEDAKVNWRGKKFVKFIFEESSKDEGEQNYLEISGYNTWPGFNLRWEIPSGNVWGQGLGIYALGDSAALQKTEFRNAQGLEKSVKPSLQAPIFLKNKPIPDTPGGVTYYDPYTANGGKVEPIYNIQAGVLGALLNDIERHERRVNEVYFKDLFLMLATTDRREITAREVEEKHQEKLLALGPVLQRTHRDVLNNAIIRVYQILDEAGLFPEAPPELKERMLNIRYTSALAYAQRAAGASALERFFGFTGNLSAAYPQVKHKVNIYNGVDHYADAIGVPAEIMVDNETAEKAASDEAQAAQGPAQATAAKDLAQGAELLSRTDTSRGTDALSYLLSQSGR